ncbi:glycosyltransferase family 2 protein [Dyadobacter sp. CY343]|uniref:glycosyltransferase family 2 protein n=1 Tax=Dyadobacter sp. CY343 TaxID=2907299 RepID=UPI001F1EE95B|nr:glycosyltransferase family 2 protein [Dyadobacter sp. CY343]MCE7058629.1 glycosyltransferase family 2 protein [Dyadobacter sp. CY343]
MVNPKISVFTPTYNRADLLQRLYVSLTKQTFRDFEWVVVDDGSTDGTADVMKEFIAAQNFPIRYQYQENAGKPMAVNQGVSMALGELFFIVDSDDWLPEDSLETMWFHWDNVKKLPDAMQFAGISGNRIHSNGEVNGGSVDYDILDTDNFDYRLSRHYKGDKAEAYATNILRQYPFPVFENEKHCPESLVWYRIANHYKLRYFNKGVYVGDYLEGGLTNSSKFVRAKYPRYSTLAYSEMASNPRVPAKGRIRANINYWRFAPYNRSQSFINKFAAVRHIWNVFCVPLGYLLYLREKKSISNKLKK